MKDPSLPEDIVEFLLDDSFKQGATHCEIRIESYSNETLNVEGKLLKSSFNHSSKGVGVRLIANGAWGLASTTDSDNESLKNVVASAVNMARSVGNRRKTPVKLRESKPVRDNVATKVKVGFSDVELRDKVDLLVECNKRLKASNEVAKTIATLVEIEGNKFIATSEGARINFKHSMTFGTLTAFGFSSGVSESAMVELGGSGGVEKMEPSYLVDESRSVGERAVRLLKAKACPNIGKTEIVMDPTFMALLTHEIIGHPSEADRVLGWEQAWGGGAWWQGMQGQMVGSDLLSAVNEGDIEGALGYLPYDDEAVKCKRTYLIKNGKLVGHIQSRQTAETFGVEATGGIKAFSYDCSPLIRMSNAFILEGDWRPEEIIEETKNGVFVKYYISPSIDDRRYRWTITPQETYVIKNGEIGELYRGGVIMGVAPEFFKSIDAVGRDLRILPVIGCGKGDPEQLICVGNGGPTIRSRATVVGRGE
ncbi:MAG: TldD/PmbA family protein [Candidatus Atabeyarchaeum deiterrae]